MEQREKSVNQDYKKYEHIISEKNTKIKQWEENYLKLEETIRMLQMEMENTKQRNLEMKQEIDKVKETEFKREREVIQLEKEKSIEELKKEKLALQVEDLEADKRKLQANCQELT